MSKNVVVVIGATGKQGGSVVDALLNDPKTAAKFSVRGTTRDVSGDKARKLAARGVDVVTADVDSRDSLTAAFQGAYAVFGVTDYWAHHDKARETQQGRNIGDAAKETGVKHLIFSTLENVTTVTKGRITGAQHFDAKADAADYITSIGVPATWFMPGFYLQNIASNLRPNPETGAPTWTLTISPSSKIPIFDTVRDSGKFVKAILLDPEEFIGRKVHAASDYASFDEIISELAKLRPKKFKDAKAVQVPRKAMAAGMEKAGLPTAVVEDLLDMFDFCEEPGYFMGAAVDADILKKNGDAATTLAEFIEQEEVWRE